MPYETILFDVQDGVATITLNRPDKYNALTLQMYSDILDALKQCERDKAVRAVILTGAGKAFSSGADLMEMQAHLSEIQIDEMLRTGLNRIVSAIRGLEKPVLAAVNGVVAGAGGGIALACDMRIASESASFVFAAFTSIGLVPDAGSTYLLPQLVGASKALELSLFADGKNRVSAAEALSLGLITRLVPADELMNEANTIGGKMAKMATKAVGLTKRAIYKASERSFADALETEAQLQKVTFQTQDFTEGIAAFLEKREAQFKGE
jgi:2-(1,2-epoxy-1,2-dihydrophenyl)acetyl-CoA isomerase